MKCRYIKYKGIGRVLIPECWAVVMSGDIRDCTCRDMSMPTPKQFARKEYNDTVAALRKEIKELQEENDYLRKHMIQDDERHCSMCKHYWCNPEGKYANMYCEKLQRQITARKKPCKHYETH